MTIVLGPACPGLVESRRQAGEPQIDSVNSFTTQYTPGSRKAAPKAARGGARPKGEKAPPAKAKPDTEALAAAVEYHQREIERLVKAGAPKPKRKAPKKR